MFRARAAFCARPLAALCTAMLSASRTVQTTATPPARSPPAAAVRPTAPSAVPSAAVGAGTKKIVRKKIVRKIVKGGSARTRILSAAKEAHVNMGEDLRRELRDIPANEPAAAAATDLEPPGDAALEPHAEGQLRQKTSMVKGYRMEEVTSLCSPFDAVFARRLPSGGFQFFAWPGTPLDVASSAIVSMPDTIRTVHAVFGRWKTPIDLVLDIDCPVPREHWSMAKIHPFQKKVLDDVMVVVSEELQKIDVKVATQVVLQSPNLKKASFHVHAKLKDAAFEDFHSLHGFLARFREKIPTVDLQIYRVNGMLRMFSCMKENHTSAMTVFNDPQWNIGFRGGKVPDEAAALHSTIVREEGSFSRLLKFEAPRNAYITGFTRPQGQADGSSAPSFPPAVLMPRTEKEAMENAERWLRSANEVEVGEWRTWIGLGICAFRIAHHFKDSAVLPRSSMETMLDAWVEASRHCPQKFKSGDCETRWAGFDIAKLSGQSDWWSAYQRLGRLEAPAREAVAAEAERREKQKSERQTRRS